MKLFSIIFLLLLLAAGTVYSQELSNQTISDEDDLYESFINGEISYSQYQTLLELLNNQIDSSSSHLWDEVPNHTSFSGEDSKILTSLQLEQQSKFVETISKLKVRPDISGLIKFREQFYIEEEPDNKYQAEYRFNYGNFKFRLNHRKEYSGRERFINRSLSYQNDSDEIIIGNYTRRLGLGTVLGYRGKLLNYSNQYDSESLLYPDYGAQNGLYYKKSLKVYDLTTYFSQQRDEEHSLMSTGLMVLRNNKKFELGIIFGFNKLKNRISDNKINLFNTAMYGKHNYRNGYFALEISRQDGRSSSWGAGVIEGRHRYRQSEIKYALWRYDDKFIDLSSGSKSANLFKTITDDEAGFSVSTRRTGQAGGMVKTIIDLHEKLELSHAAIVGAVNVDTLRWQLLSGLSYRVSKSSRFSLDFLFDQTKKVGGSNSYDKNKKEGRIEFQIQRQNYFFRSNIRYIADPTGSKYWSWLGTVRISGTDNSKFEIWLNLKEIGNEFSKIDRLYGFVKYEIFIFEKIKSGVKFNHSYSSRAITKNQSQLAFEVTAFL